MSRGKRREGRKWLTYFSVYSKKRETLQPNNIPTDSRRIYATAKRMGNTKQQKIHQLGVRGVREGVHAKTSMPRRKWSLCMESDMR
jgi:hypothetical protein